MVGNRNDIEMRITADSRAVAAGLAPAMKGLDGVQKAAAETESALEGIQAKPITLSVNDQAVENARAEIARLREGMRESLSTNVNADTSEAQKRIKQLQGQVRTLEQSDPTVHVDVTADVSQLGAASTLLTELAGSTGSLPGGLGAATGALTRLGASGAAAATGVGLGAVAVVGLGTAAADAQTQVSQLDALTQGLGAETFEELQKWAAATPFAIEDATEATKKLVAAGVPLEEIPDWLNDIGNTAAATGVPLAQAATVFAQMVSKGKASYEELQQLAEAGIPVWQVLADQLGLTVAEVQKMATEGKLGADAIALAREGINNLFPNAMQDQAATFNGQMSTLQDNLSQTGQTLGKVFLPLMSELVELANQGAGALLNATKAVVEFGEGLSDERESISDWFTNLLPSEGLRDAKHDLDEFMGAPPRDAEEGVENLGGALEGLAADVKAGLEDAEAAAKAFAAEVEEAESAVADAITAFAGLGGEVRTTVSFIINKDDLAEQIDQAIEGTKDQHPVTLPADLSVSQISGLGDLQQDLIGSISSFAELGLEEGARRAELDPTFDSQAWMEGVRRDTRGLLIDAGVDADEVSRVLTNIVGLPRVVPVSADITGAQKDLRNLTTPVDVPLAPFFPQEPGEQGKKTPAWLTELTAPITPEVEAPGVAAGTLDNVALPDGEERVADILVHLDALSLAAAQQALNLLTLTETKTIKVHLEENPTGADLTRPGAVDELLSGAVGGSGGSGGSAGLPGRPRQLAPAKTPVKVYLDGAEIAARLEARRALARAESVRRSP